MVPRRSSIKFPEARSGRGRTSTKLYEFICWDGEGAKLDGEGKPQNYILFGNCKGKYISGHDLGYREILDFIVETERLYPNAYHVSFSFGYDVNQIVKHLSRVQHLQLHQTGKCWIGKTYRLEWQRGKKFVVTKIDGRERTTATIYDVFSFFACSFVKACRTFLGESEKLDLIERDKARRSSFSSMDQLETIILPYWKIEIEYMHRLVNALKDRLFEAELFINRWHGPGALATYAMKEHGVKKHMAEMPNDVAIASQFAYAGGRFEPFKIGCYDGPVWSADINSAYPHAISQLPSLASCKWHHATSWNEIKGNSFPFFGLYRIRLAQESKLLGYAPSPLFHRDVHGLIYYPWVTSGWYWGPEAYYALAEEGAQLIEAWILEDAGLERPFYWVNEVYRKRQGWKKSGVPAQIALKLLLNSMYGKMAQRVGFDTELMTAPLWHQLEWAGFVTSFVRSRMYHMMKIFGDACIASETDGIYITSDPRVKGFSTSDLLGEWEIKRYDGIAYVQSGFYFLNNGGSIESKYRGLDPNSVHFGDVRTYFNSIDYRQNLWDEISGTTTRFVGLGAANPEYGGYRKRFCTWEESKIRNVRPGIGKRIHVSRTCPSCRNGIAPIDGLHDLAISVPDYAENGYSQPHALPWKNDPEIEWRQWQNEDEDLYVR